MQADRIDRRARRASPALSALCAVLVASFAAQAAAPHRAVLGRRLAQELSARAPGERIPIRVSLASADLPRGAGRRALVASRQQRVLAALPGGEFVLKRRYQVISGFAGRATGRAIEALRANPEVASVHLDGVVEATLGQGGPLVGALDAHVLSTGAGINVAVLDSGIDTDHPALQYDIVAEACFCEGHPSPMSGCCPGDVDTASGPGSAEDDDGHGTSVAGIITSTLGIAPDSMIAALKVLDANGLGVDSDVDLALDWVLANHETYSIRVVNLSLGDHGEYDDPGDSRCSGNPTANAIRDLALEGVVTFAASGNDGHDNGISSPACSADAISVGGVYDASFGTVQWCADQDCNTILCSDFAVPDRFVCHTNSGALLDLLAPDWKTTTSAMGGGSTSIGGTSAASPYAAAQAALLLEADPALTPADIRARMKAFGPMVTNPDNGLSFRRADVGEALEDLVAACGNSAVEASETCDDGNTTDGDCCSSTCQFEAIGSPCDDGTLCTESDTCDGAGACAGTPVVCDDANVCTDDGCDAGTGCTFAPNTSACDDGSTCTEADVCAGGACTGTAIDCDDLNACTAEACDEELGCTHAWIAGCGSPVPALGLSGRGALALVVLLSGAVGGALARRSASP